MASITESLGMNREVMALSGARFVDAFANSILIIILPLYVAEIPSEHLAFPVETLVGILIATFGLVSSFSQPFAGRASDRLDRRKIFIVSGLLLMGVATFVFVEAEQFLHLVLIRATQGLGFALTIPATLSLMSEYTEKSSRGGAMGIFTTMRMVGFATGPVLGGVIQVHYGFKTAFYVVGLLSILGAGIVYLMVREPEKLETEAAQARQLPSFRDSISKEFIILGIASIIMAAAISMMVALENEFNHRLSQTAIGFGLAFSALTISRVFLQIPLGKAADIWGRKIVIILGFIVLAPTTLMLGFVQTTGQLVMVRLAQGIGMSGISAPIFAIAGDKASEGSSGTQMSIVTMSFGLGIAGGPVLAGVMSGYVGFQSPFIVGGVLCLVAAWLVGQFVTETIVR
ncbi:MAG: MFS transporter [Candidatus Marinimicrobia bacterium]|nr:MFS transporter [Candidatus Neomarinimicrobiota bacterium]MCF7828824.1 MFS transporter [Candidatus Neomarinimicrobiota bacterium]MCF7880741.1 MFS transporter [Candidatus Neomarinimicrobiota bacterium]